MTQYINIDEKAQTVTISLDLGKAILRSEITEHAATLIVENENLRNRLAQKNKYDYYTTLIIFFAGVIGGAWTALMAFKFSL